MIGSGCMAKESNSVLQFLFFIVGSLPRVEVCRSCLMLVLIFQYQSFI